MSSNQSRSVVFLALITILCFAAFPGCASKSNPVAPTAIAPPTPVATSVDTTPAPTTGPSTAAPASVSAVMPDSIPPATSSQTILVSGANFQPGLSVAVTGVSGTTTTVSGAAIQSLTETSFQVSVTLPDVGAYSLCVTNPAAPPSAPVTIVTNPTASSRPKIAGISPGSPTQNASPQLVTVAGYGFAPGLSVVITGPGGTPKTVGGTAIQNLSSTLFQMTLVLADLGTYSLRVANTTGEPSEPWSFVVKGVEATPKPIVTSVAPSTLVAGPTAQLFYVLGSGFPGGASVKFSSPTGKTTTVSGTAIRYASATAISFSVVLDEVGKYSVVVASTTGQPSEPYLFEVKATTVPRPTISTVAAIGGVPPLQGSTAQWLYVTGTNFQSGTSAAIVGPDGASLTGVTVQFNSSATIQLLVTLVKAGTYTIRLTNPGTVTSDPFSVTVGTATSSKPTIIGLSPRSPVQNSTTLVYVVGTNFAEGLTVSVLTPSGATLTLSGSKILNVTATLFQLSTVFTEVGTHTLRILLPGGASSEPWTFEVKAP